VECTLWAPIPAFPGYEASDDGQIRNKHGRLLRQRLAGNGSLQVDIGKATAMVHNLVLRAHTGRPLTKGFYVEWRNEDRADNTLDNLMWAGKARPTKDHLRTPS
jgi:HNH endonuclease/NUMOD4 motif